MKVYHIGSDYVSINADDQKWTTHDFAVLAKRYNIFYTGNDYGIFKDGIVYRLLVEDDGHLSWDAERGESVHDTSIDGIMNILFKRRGL